MGSRLDDFLQKTLREVIQVGAHEAISDELTDHYYCLVEDYEEAGLNESEAEIKAVESLGDPRVIGKQLNNVWFPQLKWCIYWHIINLVLLVSYITLFGLEFTPFFKFLSGMIVVLISFETTTQFTMYKYLTSIAKKTDLPFVRVYNLKHKKDKSTISYIEKLTNRVALIGGSIMIVLLIGLPISEFLLDDSLDIKIILPTLNMIFIYTKIYISIKAYQSPVVIADKKGLWIQGATTPYLKWDKIASIGSNCNRSKGYVCEIKRNNGKRPYEFPSIPEDVQTLKLLYHEAISLKSSDQIQELGERN